jgi:hypothetical protein
MGRIDKCGTNKVSPRYGDPVNIPLFLPHVAIVRNLLAIKAAAKK